LAQQVIGYLSGYWINQEPDTSRYQGYGYVFLTTGFKGFVDLWLEPGARVHATHTDQPFVPLVWAFVFKVVSIFSDNPYRTDVTNHLVSGTFWGVSLLGTFLLGRLLFDRRVGIYAALFLAFIPYFSFMGYLYMIDVPMVAMSVMAIFCFLKGMKDDQVAEGSAGSQGETRGLKSALWNGRYSILAGFFYLLTILTKLIGLHLIAVFAIMYFVFKKGWQWRPLLLTGAPVAIGALVVMGVLRGMYGAEWFSLVADYAGRVTEILRDLSTRPWTEYTTLYHDGPMSIFFFFRYPTAYLGFGISLLIILGLTMRDPARSNILKEKIFLVSWSLLLILYFSLAITKTTRFIYAVYPALTILAALGFCSLLRIAKGRLSVYLVLLLLLVEMGGRHISFYDSQIAQRWIKDYEIRF
jgi:4-amino-4-deoxy-L-arabinose transferase-like glycosyltransferase